MLPNIFIPILILQLAFAGDVSIGATGGGGGGEWNLLIQNTGVSAMHMQLLHNDRVVIFDRTDFGPSNLSLPAGKCRDDPHDTALALDCTAHSAEYDVVMNKIRPLMVLTDVWCSAGSVMADGRLIQTGGFNDGERTIRVFRPCADCDWEEISLSLAVRRWYPTNHILPDGRQIIIGGRRQFNYEFYPKTPTTSGVYSLPFLAQTNDPKIENNLYPFVHLNVDGNLFIFANNRAILLDYTTNTIVRTFPQIPGGDPRNYPSTGSSVLLPLKNLQKPVIEAEVLVCGGAPKGSYVSAVNGVFVSALDTCGRIKITDPDPKWVMEKMPGSRVMCDMILLPNGDVLIINGGASGTAGWEYGRDPNFHPVLYRPDNIIGSRFEVQNPSTIPRMYHSSAILLRDGRVLVGGSNPHQKYEFVGVTYLTELSLEAFSPWYLGREVVNLRPKIVLPASTSVIGYGELVKIRFSIAGRVNMSLVSVHMIRPSFTTHSFGMNQRFLVLDGGGVMPAAAMTMPGMYEVQVKAPGTSILAPAGYYLLFVVHEKVPSVGIWIKIQ